MLDSEVLSPVKIKELKRGGDGERGREGGKRGEREKREAKEADHQMIRKSFKAKFRWFGLEYLDPLGITLLKRVAAAATKTLEKTVSSSPRMGALCKLPF